MRQKMPSSRTRLFSRLAVYDLVWAGFSPFLAFLIRDGTISNVHNVAVYCSIAAVASLVTFQWFKISSPLSSFFSVHDAFAIAKACVTTVAITAVVLFTVTRLDDAPRSVPIIHFFVLASGLLGERAIARLAARRRASSIAAADWSQLENIVVIEASRLAWFFSKMVEELASDQIRIVAILDDRQWLHNRSLNGYPIVGSPDQLSKIIDEYATHGVEIHKVVVAAHPESLSDSIRRTVRETCELRNVPTEWLHERFLLSHAASDELLQATAIDPDLARSVEGWSYWRIKRVLDVLFALAAMITIAPLAILVASLVLIDLGPPTVFWQQRIGRFGRPLRIYKFRTMRASFDRDGRAIPESRRLSPLGRLLRKNRLDEIPQLFNILIGNMSLVGPRPLLPVDQPKNLRLRLQVRPGLTGLAQINGGALLSPEEKDALDEWYVRHVSFFLDVRIMLRTMWVVFRGDRRNESEIMAALAERNGNADGAPCYPETMAT